MASLLPWGNFRSSCCPPPAWVASLGKRNTENIPPNHLSLALVGSPRACRWAASPLQHPRPLLGLSSSGCVPRKRGEMPQKMCGSAGFSPSAHFSKTQLKFCETFFSLFCDRCFGCPEGQQRRGTLGVFPSQVRYSPGKSPFFAALRTPTESGEAKTE